MEIKIFAVYRQSHDLYFDFFFFQAEDGIRDYKVTGVQTCALPISPLNHAATVGSTADALPFESVATSDQLRFSFRKRHCIHSSNGQREERFWCESSEIGRASCRERV